MKRQKKVDTRPGIARAVYVPPNEDTQPHAPELTWAQRAIRDAYGQVATAKKFYFLTQARTHLLDDRITLVVNTTYFKHATWTHAFFRLTPCRVMEGWRAGHVPSQGCW
jgi:hypothetical protein